MGKTLVIFGLLDTLIKMNEYLHSSSLDVLVDVRRGVYELIRELREIKSSNENIEFYILTNMEKECINVFMTKSESKDLFNQELNLSYEPNSITEELYKNNFRRTFGSQSKRILEIEGYDKVILIDSNKKNRTEFLSLKRKLFWNGNSQDACKYKNGVWGYIYSKSVYSISRKLKKILKKEKGIFVK